VHRTVSLVTVVARELKCEDDLTQLLASHEMLAQCILNDPALSMGGLTKQVAGDLGDLIKR